jgi:dinuclear metal center YbgI/SA1388 family protein
MTTAKELENFFNELLSPKLYSDYGPNGLQIEGSQKVQKIAFAVSATKESVEQAIKQNAQALVVHHGLFWKFHGVRTLTGPFAKRVLPLVRNNINLFGFHLPLDAHIEHGNAATLAQRIELQSLEAFGDYKGMPIGVKGKFSKPLKVSDLKEKIAQVLNHQVLTSSSDESAEISTMGIITGGANGDWLSAYHAGLDSYLTGEMSEHDWHEAKECGVHMFAGGHNATEQFGIQRLMELTAKKYDCECFFINSDNPA